MAQQIIEPSEIEFSSLSMLDETGRVFMWKQEIHRAITARALPDVQRLFSSGLLARLQQLGLIVQSEQTDFALPGFAAVLRHETAPVVSYPYEWSFEMLRRAALLVLEVNAVAMQFGYQTTDCHPYNVVFFGDQPKFVDVGSLKPMESVFQNHLYSYNEFCKTYLYPLRVWASGDSFTARRYLQRWKVMCPPEAFVAYRLGGTRGVLRGIRRKAANFRLRLQAIPHLLAGRTTSGRAERYRWLASLLFSLGFAVRPSTFTALRRAVNRCKAPGVESTWGDYHDRIYGVDGKPALSDRFKKLVGIVDTLGVKTVTDIGGNQGLLSEALAVLPSVERVICLDTDDNAVDVGYLRSGGNAVVARKLSFAVVNPFYPEVNWLEAAPPARFRSQLAMALAITHHLVLDQGYALEYVLKTVASYATRYVIVEFMPLGLYSSVTDTGIPVPSWYNQEWFLAEFKKHFRVLEVTQVEANRVIVVGAIGDHSD